jgi:hypothetical protein
MSEQIIAHPVHGTPSVPASTFLAPGARACASSSDIP